MLDWFYENWGSNGAFVIYTIIFVLVFPILQFIEDEIPHLRGHT